LPGHKAPGLVTAKFPGGAVPIWGPCRGLVSAASEQGPVGADTQAVSIAPACWEDDSTGITHCYKATVKGP